MVDCKIHIGIYEPSHIIFEGLAGVLHKSNTHYRIIKLNDFNDINSFIDENMLNVIIINPNYVQINKKEFLSLKRKVQRLYWIGLIYSYFDKELLAQFDTTIQISDTREQIDLTIDKLIQADCSCDQDHIHEQLTEREKDVLMQLVSGLANKEIADKLNISIHTVVSHRKNISQKTGIKSQSGLTIYAISNKMIDIDNLPQ